MTDYEIDELMCALMAREIRDGEWVNHGAVVPLAGAALMLAKRTHAPNVDFFYLGTVFNSINPSVEDLADLLVAPALAYSSSRALISHYDIVSFTARGNCDLQFLRPVQIDAEGNVNVSVIGRGERPRYRFHGIAVADALILVKRVVLYVTEHLPQVFVEELDFRTGTGHLDASRWRGPLGAPGAGPVSVITPLCVLDFDGHERRARLRSVHPGVSVEEVVRNTGFPIDVGGTVTESEPPTAAELRVLREVVDPLATRRLEFKQWRAEAQSRLAGRAATVQPSDS